MARRSRHSHRPPKQLRKQQPARYEEPFNALDEGELSAMDEAALAAGAAYLKDWLEHLTDDERAEYHDLLEELEAQARGERPFGPPVAASDETGQDDG